MGRGFATDDIFGLIGLFGEGGTKELMTRFNSINDIFSNENIPKLRFRGSVGNNYAGLNKLVWQHFDAHTGTSNKDWLPGQWVLSKLGCYETWNRSQKWRMARAFNSAVDVLHMPPTYLLDLGRCEVPVPMPLFDVAAIQLLHRYVHGYQQLPLEKGDYASALVPQLVSRHP